MLLTLPKELKLLLWPRGLEQGVGRRQARGFPCPKWEHRGRWIALSCATAHSQPNRKFPPIPITPTDAPHCSACGFIKFSGIHFIFHKNTGIDHGCICYKLWKTSPWWVFLFVSFILFLWFCLFQVIETNCTAGTTVWGLNSKLCFQAQQGLTFCLGEGAVS